MRRRQFAGILAVAVAAIALASLYAQMGPMASPGTVETEVVRTGTGAQIRVGDLATFHVVGRLADGTEIQNSRKSGTPVRRPVGRGLLLLGLDRGMLGMRKGEIRRFILPPDQAYGRKGRESSNVPPSATLVMEVEVLHVD